MNTTLSWPSAGFKTNGKAVTGNLSPSKYTVDREINRIMPPLEADCYEEWTDADFKVDLKRASAKIRIAAREAREDMLAGRTEPFPEP